VDPVMIEIEEPYMTIDDAFGKAVEILRHAMPADAPPTSSWFDAYDWDYDPLAAHPGSKGTKADTTTE
jgi:hypothetical protein